MKRRDLWQQSKSSREFTAWAQWILQTDEETIKVQTEGA